MMLVIVVGSIRKKTVIVFVIRIKSCEICVIIITSIVELSIKRLDL
jgi:hypothetical protein